VTAVQDIAPLNQETSWSHWWEAALPLVAQWVCCYLLGALCAPALPALDQNLDRLRFSWLSSMPQLYNEKYSDAPLRGRERHEYNLVARDYERIPPRGSGPSLRVGGYQFAGVPEAFELQQPPAPFKEGYGGRAGACHVLDQGRLLIDGRPSFHHQ